MATSTPGKRTHRRDRVARRFLYVVVGAGLLAFFAPAIVARTPLLGSLLAGVVSPEVGKLSVGSASLGWFSPVRLDRVALTDAAGRVVMHADTVAIDRTLASLLTDRRDLGTVRVHRPAVYVFARPDGSNLEDLAAELNPPADPAQPQPTGAGTPTRMTLIVTGAAVAVTDAVTGRTDIHDPIDATVVLGGTAPTVEASGFAHAAAIPAGGDLPVLPLGQSENRSGGFQFAMGKADSGANQASFRLAGVDIAAAAAPWLRRLDPSLRVGGLAEGQGGLSWWPAQTGGSGRLTQVTTSGELRVTGFDVAAAALGEDAIRVQQISVPWRVATSGGRVSLQQLGLRSDFATANVTGDFSIDEAAALAGGDWSAARVANLSADVDLARLSRLAPGLLRLRQGVALASGRVALTASVRPEESGGRAINATLATSDIVATRGDQSMRWREPIQLTLDARHAVGVLIVRRLACASSFLNGSASGDLNRFKATADLDLDRLVAQTGQLIDYGPWRLAGSARAEGEFAAVGERGFRVAGEAAVDGCVVSYEERPVVLERKLAITLGGEGQTNPVTRRPVGLTSARVTVESDGDTLVGVLTEPAAIDAASIARTPLPLDLQVSGSLRAWLRRLKSLLPPAEADSLLASLELDGAVDARAAGRFGGERVVLSSADVSATDLKLTTPTLRIVEPRVEFTGDVAWDAATGAVASQAGTLSTPTVAVRATGLRYDPAAATNAMTGVLALRADLARLAAWAPEAMGATRLGGEVVGGVRLTPAPTAGGGAAEIDLTATDFAVLEAAATGPPRVLWQEPTVRVVGGVAHDAPGDRVTLAGLAVQSQDLSGVINGAVDRLSSSPSPSITGTFDYDLAELSPLLASRVGPGVALRGKHQATFELATATPATALASTGPAPVHWSRRWRARLTAPWSGASLYGLPVGPGAVTASLADGAVQTEPLAFNFGTAQSPLGSASLRPVVQLDPQPAGWGLPAGPLVTDVRVTPEVSERMLKFLAPVLADATRSDGTFSIETDGVRAPLSDARLIETTGRLRIRNLRVTPGPGVASWVSIGRTAEALIKNRDPAALAARPTPTLLSITDRTVNFQVAGGRVYHQGLVFDVDGVPVTSSGSVGFDESLDMVLAAPIQDDWLGNDRGLAGLRGQVIRLPVRGTLSDPKIDRRELQNLSQQLIRSGIRGAVEGEIGRALEKLFN